LSHKVNAHPSLSELMSRSRTDDLRMQKNVQRYYRHIWHMYYLMSMMPDQNSKCLPPKSKIDLKLRCVQHFVWENILFAIQIWSFARHLLSENTVISFNRKYLLLWFLISRNKSGWLVLCCDCCAVSVYGHCHGNYCRKHFHCR